jgi:hypothetical protein
MASQRKGERSATQNEREFPNIVELPVPDGGFRTQLDSMYDFHRERGIEPRRGHGQRREGQDFVRWCFADGMDAEAFAKMFCGKQVPR